MRNYWDYNNQTAYLPEIFNKEINKYINFLYFLLLFHIKYDVARILSPKKDFL